MDNEIYYKIYRSSRIKNKLTVVTMQWFDESDYVDERFFRDKNGDILKFDDEDEAIDWLIKNIKKEKIDPEYLKRIEENEPSWENNYYK
jgi:hypothetical protein